MDGQVMQLSRKWLPAGVKPVGEIGGYLIADFRMTTDTIVEHLDITTTGYVPITIEGIQLTATPSRLRRIRKRLLIVECETVSRKGRRFY